MTDNVVPLFAEDRPPPLHESIDRLRQLGARVMSACFAARCRGYVTTDELHELDDLTVDMREEIENVWWHVEQNPGTPA